MSVADTIYGTLIRFGRLMLLRRTGVGPGGTLSGLDVTVQGVCMGFDGKPLVGPLQQGLSHITVTNTEIADAQWPGPPKKEDQIVVDGRTRTIDSVNPQYFGPDLLVFEIKVVG